MQLVDSSIVSCDKQGDESAFTQPYSLFAGADNYSEPQHHSEELEQEMIDLITLQRLLSLAADDTPSKVGNDEFYVRELRYLFVEGISVIRMKLYVRRHLQCN